MMRDTASTGSGWNLPTSSEGKRLFGLKCPELGPGLHDFVLASEVEGLEREKSELVGKLAARGGRTVPLDDKTHCEESLEAAEVERLRGVVEGLLSGDLTQAEAVRRLHADEADR